ncbi:MULTISPECIES: FtsB family cell division protein [Paenibacillus]|uniref:FtsB family cell division protein n=1 Tax=Paenibacillus TaxID=44249 RepID=UPI0003668DCF|nr:MULTISPECIES: septum formation initiator family protein [Paenibacillus]
MIPKPVPMRGGSQQHKKQTAPSSNHGARRRLRIWMVVMVLFLGWAIYTFVVQSIHLSEKKAELAQQEAKKVQAEAALGQSQNEVKRLEDPEYIGQVARKQYGMYLPGEKPIWATDPEEKN